MPRFMSPLRPRYMRSPSDIPKDDLQVASEDPSEQQAHPIGGRFRKARL